MPAVSAALPTLLKTVEAGGHGEPETRSLLGGHERALHQQHVYSFTEYSVPSPRNRVTDANPFTALATYAT